MIIVVFSFILDNLVTLLFNYSSILYPLFTILSLILIYPKFNKRNNNYFIFSFILGLIYDVAVTDTFFLNAIIFLLLSYFLNKIFNKIPYNYFSVFFSSLGTIIYYRLVTYIVLIILNYLSFNIFFLLKSIYESIILNLVYISIFYLIMTSKKLIFKRT